MSNNNSNTKQDAIQLLRVTSYFHDASDELVSVLAEHMVPVIAEPGHVFLEEGEDIHSIMILERGILCRSKLSVDSPSSKESMKASIRSMPRHLRQSSMAVSAVLIDTLQGKGRITGLLHNVQEGTQQAYATVYAGADDEQDVKVWLLNGADFRDIITSTPQFALEVMAALARELRQGSKSLRSLIKNTKEKKKTGSSTAEDGESSKTCKVLCYDATSWVKEGFGPAIEEFNKLHQDKGYSIEMDYTTERLSEQTATFAAGYDAVCLFVNDNANADVLQTLSLLNVRMIGMRCAGFDRVDTKAARAFGLTVARVPAYSPYAVAEHAIALLMAVNRKINKASNRVKMANFTLDAGLMGMDIYGKTVGVMGTGKIGQILSNIVLGFGAKLICYDVYENEDIKKAGGVYVSKEECMSQADVLFLMMPLLPATKHTINFETLRILKRGVLLVNTSRGGLIDTKALLEGLRNGRIAGVGMDVYEHEQEYFFQDWSARQIKDPDLVALLGLHNVVLTAHQAFFTKEAVDKIVSTTVDNIYEYAQGKIGQAHPNNCIPPLESPWVRVC